MFPGPDDFIKFVPRTLGVRDLSLTNKLIILGQFSVLDSKFEQFNSSGYLFLDRTLVAEIANEGDADAPIVVVMSVSTGHVPASAVVDVAISSNEEVVTDIDPALGLDVERLNDTHAEYALGFVVAGLGACVADNCQRCWLDL